MKERIFDKVPTFIQILIISPLLLAVFLRGDDWLNALCASKGNNLVSIVCPVSKKVLSINALYQVACLLTVRLGAFCNNGLHRHAVRINGQMYLRV